MNILNPITNLTEPRLLDEWILYNPELGGVDYFIDVYTGGADGRLLVWSINVLRDTNNRDG